ncbi:MAG: AI-2E family transporter [Pirellulales bacterium]|nr:AI-2E family transporter [Pirellulales bacterium]
MARLGKVDRALLRTSYVITAFLLIAALYLGQDVFLPLTLAILLTFLLSGAVSRLERWGMSRIPATILACGIVAAGTAVVSMIVVGQAVSLAENLPSYRQNIVTKIQAIQGSSGSWVKRTLGFVEQIQEEVAAPQDSNVEDKNPGSGTKNTGQDPSQLSTNTTDANTQKSPLATPARPVPVQLMSRENGLWAYFRTISGPLWEPVALIGLVSLFTIFMLIDRDDLRNRLVILLGNQRLYGTTQMLDEAAQKVGRYLRMQLLINTLYGAAVAVGLAVVGLPNALLWGFLAMILRFIPYLGPLIAMAFPIMLSLAVFEGWIQPLIIGGLFVTLELISNNILEPWLYGSSTGLTAMGILVAALFWTSLWGTPGLIMAIPITVCMIVIGRHFPQFRGLRVLLSDDEPMPPAAVIYQRLLARDPDQAAETLTECASCRSYEVLCDEVLLPAIKMYEQDRHQDVMDADEQKTLQADFQTLFQESLEDALATTPTEVVPTKCPARILCIPARDQGDLWASELLARLLLRLGHSVDVIPVNQTTGETAEQFDRGDYDLAIINAVPPAVTMHIQYLCKRLRAVASQGKILVGYWATDAFVERVREKFTSRGADQVVTRFQDAVQWLQREAPSWSAARQCRTAADNLSLSASPRREANPRDEQSDNSPASIPNERENQREARDSAAPA